jgi:hypothetical protein
VNYECTTGDGVWYTCQIVDNRTSPTHMFVRAETAGGVRHLWIANDRIRRIDNKGIEPSH